jgi:hypothetical protein
MGFLPEHTLPHQNIRSHFSCFRDVTQETWLYKLSIISTIDRANEVGNLQILGRGLKYVVLDDDNLRFQLL